ncbi:MAG: leucine-rich repeat domain-containing protein [Thermosynechococcaceae cyanobacterium]
MKASEVSAGSTADRQWAQTGRSQEGNTELELGNLSLTQVPSGIGQLTNLRSLSLTCNQLSGLPAEIGQLNNLQVLDLDNNQLCSLPLEISQLSNLIKPVEG